MATERFGHDQYIYWRKRFDEISQRSTKKLLKAVAGEIPSATADDEEFSLQCDGLLHALTGVMGMVAVLRLRRAGVVKRFTDQQEAADGNVDPLDAMQAIEAEAQSMTDEANQFRNRIVEAYQAYFVEQGMNPVDLTEGRLEERN